MFSTHVIPFWIPFLILIDPFFFELECFFFKYYHRICRNGKIYYTKRFDTSQLHSITFRINLPQATTMVTIFSIFFLISISLQTLQSLLPTVAQLVTIFFIKFQHIEKVAAESSSWKRRKNYIPIIKYRKIGEENWKK